MTIDAKNFFAGSSFFFRDVTGFFAFSGRGVFAARHGLFARSRNLVPYRSIQGGFFFWKGAA